MMPLKLRSTIGILGGGQLGRMLALAAARLGLRCHVFCPDADAPAVEVVRRVTTAAYLDFAALARFAADVDVVTYETENVPLQAVRFLAERGPVFPDPGALAVAQDRLAEKSFITGIGINVAPFRPVESLADLNAGVAALGCPTVLKTRRFGYDGKGQAKIGNVAETAAAWDAVGRQPCVVEQFVKFDREISVILARGHNGAVECFDLAENEHSNHILKVSRVPASVPLPVAEEARRIATAIAHALDYVGVLAVEMFVVSDGREARLVVNEIAPRVHNSGHWTLDGCAVSQFEQHIRAIAGWALALPIRHHQRIEMTNIIGQEIEDYGRYLDRPGTTVHLYGKADSRAARKMGHVTRLFDLPH